MCEKIIVSVIASLILAFIGWFKIWGRDIWDRHKVCKWLKSNTQDKPYESHADVIKIAKGTQLPEDRVRRACMSCKEIYQHSKNDKEQWSVWREEPQSIYDGLTKEEIKNRLRGF